MKKVVVIALLFMLVMSAIAQAEMKTVVCSQFDSRGDQAFCYGLNRVTGAVDTSESQSLEVYLLEGWKILSMTDITFLGEASKKILLQRAGSEGAKARTLPH
ncbi:MAG: hypothetical protein M0Z67_10085 [Nitrospiraceae bacterium]|nr:hypothetical protein [Nitrospiraceae bacterium]